MTRYEYFCLFLPAWALSSALLQCAALWTVKRTNRNRWNRMAQEQREKLLQGKIIDLKEKVLY
jgi:hypothetical protein